MRMKKTLMDKVAIVTGSTRGIGKAIALELCRLGSRVVINGRDATGLLNAEKAFKNMGFDVLPISADVTDYHQSEALIHGTVERFGRLDILITNAAINGISLFEKTDPSVFRKVMDSNIYGSVFPAMAALPHLRAARGSLVFISSLAGLMGLPLYSAYSAGKMSLTAVAQCLKSELYRSGVHVGIMYVGLTANERDKRLVSGDGRLVALPRRPPLGEQSRERVARSIILMIRRRRHRMILTALGRMEAVMLRICPLFVQSLLGRSQGWH